MKYFSLDNQLFTAASLALTMTFSTSALADADGNAVTPTKLTPCEEVIITDITRGSSNDLGGGIGPS